MAKANLSADRLRELLDYNLETGIFTWKVGRYCGQRAGTVERSGYRRIRIANRCWKEHRLVWLYVHGAEPTETLDHINGDKTDNRVANLRPCSSAENQQNRRKASKRSKSGVLGVYQFRGLWLSRVSLGPQVKRLGSFRTVEQAQEAYIAAKRELHPFNTL